MTHHSRPARLASALLGAFLLSTPAVPAIPAPPREPSVPGVGREAAVPPSDAAVRDAVREADRELARAVAEHDEAAFRRRLAPDALLLGATTERGRDAAVAAWQPLLRPDGPDLHWEPEEVLVAGARDLAVTTGSFRFTPAPADVAAEGQEGRYVTVWRHDQRGGWRAAVDGTLLGARGEAVVQAAQLLDVDGRVEGETAGAPDLSDLRPRVDADTRPEHVSASNDLAWGLGTLTVRFAGVEGTPAATAPHLAVWTGSDRTDPALEAIGTFRPPG